MMQDTIRYKVRGGRLINHFFVKKDVVKIFHSRTEYLRDHFENDIADVKFP